MPSPLFQNVRMEILWKILKKNGNKVIWRTFHYENTISSWKFAFSEIPELSRSGSTLEHATYLSLINDKENFQVLQLFRTSGNLKMTFSGFWLRLGPHTFAVPRSIRSLQRWLSRFRNSVEFSNSRLQVLWNSYFLNSFFRNWKWMFQVCTIRLFSTGEAGWEMSNVIFTFICSEFDWRKINDNSKHFDRWDILWELHAFSNTMYRNF